MKKNQSGITLIEVIISMTLAVILMAAAAVVVNGALTSFYRMQSTTKAITISDMLLDKVTGELEGAAAVTGIDLGTLDGGNASNDGTYSNASFYNSNGNAEYIGINAESYLVIHYYPVTTQDNHVIYNAVDWTFDPGVYQGYQMTSLKFEQIKDNVFLITMKIKDKYEFEYTATRYAKCFDFDSTTYGKIRLGVKIDLSDISKNTLN